ncbi:MATE family efflux transporter [Palleniella muris]|uniref:MATE family efflux transporter n=1 Tax=Palleniella muris TaxID=3038145 RepID=A0AC61QTV4_9BACT|nr:MATE family efflux transporter [Palleniella muris]TGX83893.1 MATE family efflux transporter [Palleniella muris]
MNNNRDSLDFSKEPVGRLFRKMFLPTLVGMISMVVLNITDGAFVGHGVGSDALAAVSIVAPLYLIVSGLGLMFGIGGSVVASIHLAKGNIKAANINLTQSVLASVIVGVVLGAFVFTFQKETCLFFGCSEALLPLACSYIKWVALLTPFNMFGMTGMFMVRLDGNPKFAMGVNCFIATLNIVLDYLLIFPLQMGLEGAAIATMSAFATGSIPLLWFLLKKTKTVHFRRLKTSRTSMELTARNLGYQMKIGASGLLGELALASTIIVGNYVFIHYLGEDGVAAFSVGCYCLPIVFMVGNAIVQSVQPIISFAHGMNDSERLAGARRIAFGTAVATGIVGMLFMWIGASLIAMTFMEPGCHAYELCRDGLPYYSPAFLFIAINVVMTGYLQSIEEARKAMVFTVLRGFVFCIPCFILLPMAVGSNGAWLALPLAEAMTTAVILMTAKRKAE